MSNAPADGSDGSPCRPPSDLDSINAELQLAGPHGFRPPPDRPSRKTLPHSGPPWISGGAIWFITICCRNRGRKQLTVEPVASALLASAMFFHQRRWFIHLFLLMPDHLHALIGCPPHEEMKQVVSAWKKYQATHSRILWQRDFFDHRLRGDESFEEKAFYIKMNPVRAGLVTAQEDWPYVLAFHGRDGTPLPSEDG